MNSELFFDHALNLLCRVTRFSAPCLSMWMTLAAGVLVFLLIAKMVQGIAGVSRSEWIHLILSSAVAVALLLALTVVWRVYGMPYAAHWARESTLLAAGSIVILLVVCVPVMAVIQRGGYIPIALSVILGLLAAGAVILLLQTMKGAMKTGENGFGKAIERREITEGVSGE